MMCLAGVGKMSYRVGEWRLWNECWMRCKQGALAQKNYCAGGARCYCKLLLQLIMPQEGWYAFLCGQEMNKV